jgi:hypothetical protein
LTTILEIQLKVKTTIVVFYILHGRLLKGLQSRLRMRIILQLIQESLLTRNLILILNRNLTLVTILMVMRIKTMRICSFLLVFSVLYM